MRVRMLLSKQANYTVHLKNDVGHTNPNPRVNSIRVNTDAPPTVQLVKPADGISVAPGDELPIIVRESRRGAPWILGR